MKVVTDLIWRHAFAFDGGTFTFHSVSVSWRDFFSMPGIEDIPHLVLKICYSTDGHFEPAKHTKPIKFILALKNLKLS